MKVIVFIGPSVRVEDARCVVNATYLPPVQMGDVYRAVRERADVICLLDGIFERVPAVWHKEILFALSQGVRVIGAASMGALRAAELHTLGMEGVGRIFEAYRDGVLDGDDEVALVHSSHEDGYRPLSAPLVNIRLGLARAVEVGVLGASLAQAAVESMKSLFYADRSWPAVYAALRRTGASTEVVEGLRAWIEAARPNAKREDAMEALAYLRETASVRAPREREWVFEPTELWCQLVATRESTSDEATRRDVRTHALLFRDDAEDLARGALLQALVADAASRIGIEITPERTAAAARAFRCARGLRSAAALRNWMKTNDVSIEEFAALVEHEARARELERLHRPQLDEGVIAELRRRGDYRPVADDCARIARAAPAGGGFSFTELELPVPALTAWYRYASGRERLEHRLVHPSDAQSHVLRAFVAERAIE